MRTISAVSLPDISVPSIWIEPDVSTMLQIARSVVVLPAPLAPSTTTTSPVSTSRLMSRSTWIGP
jgi:hypothetical protein